MRYEGRHLFFAVVLNTITPTIPEAKSQGTVLNRALRVFCTMTQVECGQSHRPCTGQVLARLGTQEDRDFVPDRVSDQQPDSQGHREGNGMAQDARRGEGLVDPRPRRHAQVRAQIRARTRLRAARPLAAPLGFALRAQATRRLRRGRISRFASAKDPFELRSAVHSTLRLAFLSPRVIRAIMQGQEPDGLSLAALRTTLAAASQWASPSRYSSPRPIGPSRRNPSGCNKSKEIAVCVHIVHFAANYLFATAKHCTTKKVCLLI